MKPRFSPQLSVPLIHPLSGETYALVRADALRQTPDELADLIAACNEPPIYEWLFRERLAGQPYDRARAAGFHVWSREGWRDGTHFVFALLSPCGRLAGMLDIKSTDLEEAEVGYWLRSAYSGLMSATLDALAPRPGRQATARSMPACGPATGVRWRCWSVPAGCRGDRTPTERTCALIGNWCQPKLPDGWSAPRRIRIWPRWLTSSSMT